MFNERCWGECGKSVYILSDEKTAMTWAPMLIYRGTFNLQNICLDESCFIIFFFYKTLIFMYSQFECLQILNRQYKYAKSLQGYHSFEIRFERLML